MSETERVNELAQAINIRDIIGEKKVNQPLADKIKQVAEEGMVLLENNGILPIQKGAKVSLFGRSQNDYFYVGYGSGGEVNPPYCVNPVEGLQSKDIILTPWLKDLYQKFSKDNFQKEAAWGLWPRFLPELELTDDQVFQASQESDLAIVVIGRAAGEDKENILEPGSYYLTDQEKNLLDQVTKYFSQVVVVLNIGNIIDMSWINDYPLSAVLLAWQTGMESGNSLANLLVGDVNPSGKLPVTVANDYNDYPSAQYFGHEEKSIYVEDIYVGYRYFETFAKSSVLYPFGYGLSYTTFKWDGKFEKHQGKLHIEAELMNTGKCAGQEVLQVYIEQPQGALGKPEKVLIAYKKSQLLEPNQTETMSLEIPDYLFASYDDKTRFAYLLEAGVYKIHIGNSVRNTICLGSWTLDQDVILEQLSQKAAPEEKFDRMVAKLQDGIMQIDYEPVTLQSVSVMERVEEGLKEDVLPISEQPFGSTGKTMRQIVESLTPSELDAITRGEGAMDSPLGPKGNAGILGGTRQSLRDKGIPVVVTTDGPAGIRLNYYASLLPCGTSVASTFNDTLTQEMTALYGQEMIDLGSDIILAPGLNIHRNPLGGRNFEYFSEDPLLSGKMASAYVRGIQSQGVGACPKHFACNNQETNRNYNNSIVSERALREIYLKGFEICVKDSDPWTIMSSYNKVNGVWAHYHYDLATAILRQEWQYKGLVMTDWWMRPAVDPNNANIENDAYRIRAQVDILMPGGVAFNQDEGDGSLIKSLQAKDGIQLKEVHRSAYNILNLIQKLKK